MISSLGAKPLGVATRAVHAELRGRQHQRVADVVAVADVGEVQALRRAEALFQREEVGDRLAGMLEVGERVDDWDAASRLPSR